MTPLSYADLRSKIFKLEELVVILKAENADLEVRLTEYEHRFRKTSRSNSCKPPSSDCLGKPNVPVRQEKSDRPSGGRAGHKGHTLRRSEHIDHILDHRTATCTNCGDALRHELKGFIPQKRQVKIFPVKQPLDITDRQICACQCAHCGETTTGAFPKEVKAPVQYGRNLQERVVYLASSQLLPIRRISQVINTFCGARLSEGTICNIIKAYAQRFKAVHTYLGGLVKDVPVTHFDETGMRVKGSLKWFHVGTTEAFCYFWLGKSRGDVMMGAKNIAIHDHFPS